MKVVHFVHAYLHTTQNWCYQLIKNLSSVKLVIVSEQILNEGAFPLPDARFIIAPYARWSIDGPTLRERMTARLTLTLGLVWRRLMLFRMQEVDIMHAHFSFMGWRYLWLSRMTSVPLVVSFYGFDYEYLPKTNPVWVQRYRKLFKKAALFLVEGTAGRNKLIQMGCSAEKIKVVRLGVPVDKIPYYERKKKSGELKLVQIASFVEKKGHDVTIKAFIRSFRRSPHMTLTLVGKDTAGIRDSLKRSIAEASLESHVEFIDGIDFSRLYSFMREYHVFIHPSRYARNGDCEGGAPVVLLDAQATGMPVLSTFHCDIPDEVVHGETGILVNENDIETLSKAIDTFYAMDEPIYLEYCRRARKHVERNYEIVQCSAKLKRVYENLLEDRPRRMQRGKS
jgi:colanic acid/amylovoran biosynthesis glycosyltransferase